MIKLVMVKLAYIEIIHTQILKQLVLIWVKQSSVMANRKKLIIFFRMEILPNLIVKFSMQLQRLEVQKDLVLSSGN